VTVLLRHEDVEQLVTIELSIDAMSEIFRLEGEGGTHRPHRYDVPTGRGWLRLMPVVAPGIDAFGFKAMHLTQRVGVRYAIWVYELSTGKLRGILDARVITAMRTAATTAVATRALARSEVHRTAIVGTGQEARTHLAAMHAVRPVPEVRVYSRSAENRTAFIKEMTPLVDTDLVDCGSLAEATAGADIVVLATKSPEPVLFGEHLEAGMRVNSIGSARTDQFELATDTFGRFSAIVCDSKDHVFAEAGDAIAALGGAHADLDAVDNLSDLVVGSGRGRRRDDEITLFKSVGTATQDLALAVRLLDLASSSGFGQSLGAFPDMKSFA
jgi:alanine dehydrogenase